MPPILREEHDLLTDYGDFYRGAARFTSATPRSLDEVAEALQHASEQSLNVRVRGHHHSMNGSSVPRSDELLVYTAGLDHYRCEEEGTITVGAGVVVFDLEQMLRSWGFRLELVNDGGHPTATAAGFVCAGGIGEDTWLYGGFWETVTHVTLYTVAGERLSLSPTHPLFPWLFGSMGQLGVIAEVTLRVLPVDERDPPASPVGRSGVVAHAPFEWEKNFWLTLFVPDDEWKEAQDLLQDLADRHSETWTRRNDYVYPIRFRTFNPPLIYPKNERFAAVGVWGTSPDGARFDFARLAEMERHFDRILTGKPHWRRYIQSEMTFGERDWSDTFGEEVFAGFTARKDELDPQRRLNPGVVFPAGPGVSVLQNRDMGEDARCGFAT